MERAIRLGWPGLKGKCRSIFLGYSHWSPTGRSGVMKAPSVSQDNSSASRTSAGKAAANTAVVAVAVGTAVNELVPNIELSTFSDIQATLFSQQVCRDDYSSFLKTHMRFATQKKRSQQLID